MTYTPDKRERDARLAVAMKIAPESWRYECEEAGHSLDDGVFCYDCCAGIDRSEKIPPRFHTSHDAKHALLTWLAGQQDGSVSIADRFVSHLVAEIKTPALDVLFSMGRGAFYSDEVLALMLATPDAVAIAADEALRAAGYYGEVEK